MRSVSNKPTETLKPDEKDAQDAALNDFSFAFRNSRSLKSDTFMENFSSAIMYQKIVEIEEQKRDALRAELKAQVDAEEISVDAANRLFSYQNYKLSDALAKNTPPIKSDNFAAILEAYKITDPTVAAKYLLRAVQDVAQDLACKTNEEFKAQQDFINSAVKYLTDNNINSFEAHDCKELGKHAIAEKETAKQALHASLESLAPDQIATFSKYPAILSKWHDEIDANKENSAYLNVLLNKLKRASADKPYNKAGMLSLLHRINNCPAAAKDQAMLNEIKKLKETIVPRATVKTAAATPNIDRVAEESYFKPAYPVMRGESKSLDDLITAIDSYKSSQDDAKVISFLTQLQDNLRHSMAKSQQLPPRIADLEVGHLRIHAIHQTTSQPASELSSIYQYNTTTDFAADLSKEGSVEKWKKEIEELKVQPDDDENTKVIKLNRLQSATQVLYQTADNNNSDIIAEPKLSVDQINKMSDLHQSIQQTFKTFERGNSPSRQSSYDRVVETITLAESQLPEKKQGPSSKL